MALIKGFEIEREMSISPETPPGWTRKHTELKPFSLIIRTLYPTNSEYMVDTLMRRSEKYLLRYLAWESVRRGRGAHVVGLPLDSHNTPIPYTGFEGWYIGSQTPFDRRVLSIARKGWEIRGQARKQLGDYGLDISFLDAVLQGDQVVPVQPETLRYAWNITNSIFNEARKDSARSAVDSEKAKKFREETYRLLNSAPPTYYDFNPLKHMVTLNFPLPEKVLEQPDIDTYVVSFTPEEREGHTFMQRIGKAGIPPVAALLEQWANYPSDFD